MTECSQKCYQRVEGVLLDRAYERINMHNGEQKLTYSIGVKNHRNRTQLIYLSL